MSRPDPKQVRNATYLSLAALGAFSQIAQALLSRELLVAFHGNEISLGAFYGAWLWWIAVGAFGVAFVRRRRARSSYSPMGAFRACLLVTPALLAAQVEAARAIRAFTDTPAIEIVPLGQLLVATLLVALPTSLAVGIAFPLGCEILARTRTQVKDVEDATEAGQSDAGAGGEASGRDLTTDVRDVSHLYLFEAAGALAGGLLFTFVFIEWLGSWRTIGAAAVLLAAGAYGLGRTTRAGSAAAIAVALAGATIAATPVGSWIHKRSEQARFHRLHPGLELADMAETRYGHVAIARFGEQTSIAIDGRIAVSFPDRRATARDAAYFHAQSNGARHVLLFGGIASGLAAELLRYPVESVVVIEDDETAFEHVRDHLDEETHNALADPRLRVHIEDGRHYTNRGATDARYDLVLALTPDPASANLNRYFTRDFYESVAELMTPGGVLCTAVSTASNYLGRDVASYSASVFRTLIEVFPHVVVAPGDAHVFCASRQADVVTTDARVLATRYANTDVIGRTFPGASFESILPPDRVAFVRRSLEESDAEANTDLRPSAYYHNMLLWGSYTSSGFTELLHALKRMGLWTWITPLLIFAVLLLLRASLEAHAPALRRRGSATFAVAVLGFIAMAGQMVLLLSYQANIGFVFGRIALLNGLFMTGLAVGAGAVGRVLAARSDAGTTFGALMVLLAGGCAALPPVLQLLSGGSGLWVEVSYLALVTGVGVMTGTGFPLAVGQAHADHGDVVRTSGTVEAADHVGGAVGGLLAGAILVPLLGAGGTSYLLAIAAAIAGMVLLLSEVAAANPQARATALLRRRGYASFPFTRFSWLLVFISVSVLAVSLIARQTAPGPAVHFDDETLIAVSHSQEFQLSDQPMPHYVGTGGESAPARTVSLATMPVASDVRGYAGPLNLLVSVDERGNLLAARYLDSDETPSYIHAIDDWLASLSGVDLAAGPLSSDDIDAMTGATITSEAVLESINRAARAGGEHGLGISIASAAEADAPGLSSPLRSPKAIVGLLLLALFFPAFLSAREWPRLAYQGATLVVFGFVFNTLLTEVDIANVSVGRFPSLASNFHWYALWTFVGLTTLLWGQVYCGYVCPFGALQEFLSRVGRALRLRGYAIRWIEMRMRYAKFAVAASAFSLFWITNDLVWVSFNPMQHLFAFQWRGWITVLVASSLIGAIFYYRFWCRYLCPAGAVLALGNKLAFWRSRAPARVFQLCDLGVRDEFDVDCIHCNRCITRTDLGLRK